MSRNDLIGFLFIMGWKQLTREQQEIGRANAYGCIYRMQQSANENPIASRLFAAAVSGNYDEQLLEYVAELIADVKKSKKSSL